MKAYINSPISSSETEGLWTSYIADGLKVSSAGWRKNKQWIK